MSIFKRLFGKSDSINEKPREKKIDIEELLLSENINNSIVELDNYICEICDWGEKPDNLTNEQKNFFFNQNLEREINNGGFYQYLFNSSGDFALETINSLKIIGADKTATILQQAIDQFPDKIVPKNRTERQEVLEKIEETANEIFEDLDQKFLVYDDDLNTLNIEFVRQNKNKF